MTKARDKASGDNFKSTGILDSATSTILTLDGSVVSLSGDYLRIPLADSDPTGAEGAMYFDTDTKATRIHNGTAWQNMALDLSPFSTFNTSSMSHSQVNTQGAGSTKITNNGASAWSVFSKASSADFGGHDGHNGSPDDYPAYIAIDFGQSKAVNRLKIFLHANSFGYFDLEGSNDAGSGSFHNSGNWIALTFTTSNNSSNNQNAGGTGSGLSEGSSLTFEYNNNVPYRYYRMKIKDNSRPAQTLGTSYGGWASYYWELYRE